ncbi:MAG TPA: DNA-3-methyladenine glycosylase [Candidatus Limnocylindria bacterium]
MTVSGTRSILARAADPRTALAGKRLPRDFYARPTLEVARDLLGKVLALETASSWKTARIVEVEAYLGDRDPASHAYRGLTPRTAPMFGPPGRSYVYFVYGMYHCLNVVTESDGVAGAVLLRGAEPLTGFDESPPRALAGPGKLARAFGLTTKHTNLDLVRSDLSIHDAPRVPPSRIVRSVRIGLGEHATTNKPWRLYVRGSNGVSRP